MVLRSERRASREEPTGPAEGKDVRKAREATRTGQAEKTAASTVDDGSKANADDGDRHRIGEGGAEDGCAWRAPRSDNGGGGRTALEGRGKRDAAAGPAAAQPGRRDDGAAGTAGTDGGVLVLGRDAAADMVEKVVPWLGLS